MNIEKINRCLSHYNVGNAEHYEELLKTTSGNISYVVTTPSGQYVLRTLVRQTEESASSEYEIQKTLDKHHLTTPVYLLTNNGEITFTVDDSTFVLSKKIVGSRQAADTIPLARSMGATMAKIHGALDGLSVLFNTQQWFNPKNIADQLEIYSGPSKNFIEIQTKAYLAILDKGLPKALIHGDFHTNNIFSDHDRVTAIFDFESAEYTVRILDLARLYLTYVKVTDLNPEAVLTAIMQGYNSGTSAKLSEEELSEFTNACIFVALVSSVSIYNHGNTFSSEKYLEIAKKLIAGKQFV